MSCSLRAPWWRTQVTPILACILPLVFLCDLLWPVLVESAAFSELAQARGLAEPHMDSKDFATSLLLAVLAALPFWANRHWPSLLMRVTLASWASFLSWCAIEVAIRSVSVPLVHPPNLMRVYEPDPEIMPGISGPSVFSTNSLGIRGPEWRADAYRILCIGGSTTICTYLDDRETWPALLMGLLNKGQSGRRTWVGNVGRSGHDTYHHIEVLQHLPAAARVDCCIILCGVNDFEHSFRLRTELRERLAPSRTFYRNGANSPLIPIAKQTYVYNAIQRILLRTPLALGMEREDRKGRMYQRRRVLREQAAKDYPLPDSQNALAQYKENILRIGTICKNRGIRCVFVSQPTMWRKELPRDLQSLIWSKPVGSTGRAVSIEDLARGMSAFNDTLIEVCTSAGFEWIDLARACPKDSTVFFDDEHFNEGGARRVAEVIAEYLLGKPGAASHPN